MRHLSTTSFPASKTTTPGTRSGFTLLELLAVVAIISILVALILPALSGVRRRAAVTAIQAELRQMDQAITMFESRYGGMPASNLVIPAVGGTWDVKSRAIVRGYWPQFNFATNGGLGNSDAIHLNGAECLVFFLGGVRGGTTDAPILAGFSKDPATPWIADPNSDGPLFEFDLGRISDVDGDGWYEYLAETDSALPILFLSSRGKRYDTVNETETSSDPYPNDDYDVLPEADRDRNLQSAYFDSSGSKPVRPNSYQLIHPGADGEYGNGGVFPDPNDYSTRVQERDNISNFSDGTFN